ncbi:MAG: hypothetical protein JXA64_10265 [Candidatus Fermentibacteraceae bacterium]|nr:hypothetical protein [Candidatus Fermentibacteraceae bacterium]
MALLVPFTSLVLSLTAAGEVVSPPPLDSFIYPGEEVVQFLVQLDDQRLETSMYAALEELMDLGGENILFCRIQRIEAPLAGYLFDGLWNAEIEGEDFTTFRIGIEDGSGDGSFVLLARGVDESGGVHWYPPPGPDFRPTGNMPMPESLLDYEFLLDRGEFEILEEHYPRPDDDSTE